MGLRKDERAYRLRHAVRGSHSLGTHTGSRRLPNQSPSSLTLSASPPKSNAPRSLIAFALRKKTPRAVRANELPRLTRRTPNLRAQRRRFAYACLDWSERRPHLAGALGAALMQAALKRKWVDQDLEGRGVEVTGLGRRELRSFLGLEVG